MRRRDGGAEIKQPPGNRVATRGLKTTVQAWLNKGQRKNKIANVKERVDPTRSPLQHFRWKVEALRGWTSPRRAKYRRERRSVRWSHAYAELRRVTDEISVQ